MRLLSVLSIFVVILLPLSASSQTGLYRSGIFLHHSTGYTIWGPNGSSTSIPREIALFNDAHALTGADSVRISERWFPADSNSMINDWSTWDSIFTLNKPADVRPFLSSNKIIVIKSCFPSSAVISQGSAADTLVPGRKTIYNYKWHWNRILNVMRQHPENFFVIWTNAPIVASSTSDTWASNANRFCRWAKDTLVPPANVYVFDFFHKVADASGKLAPAYAVSPTNSHPNAAATALVAPQFVQEIFTASMAYESPTVPSAPSLVSPAQGATQLPVPLTLQWSAPAYAESYRLQLAEDALFQSLVLDTTNLTATHLDVSALQHGFTYFWRALAWNGAGSSVWSSSRNFTTAELPLPPVPVSPPAASTEISRVPVLAWAGHAQALDYHVQVAKDPDFSAIEAEETALVDTMTQIGPLESLTVYYWRVSVRTVGGESEWSTPSTFTTEAQTYFVPYAAGWNIVSLPVEGSTMLKESVFPTSTSPAYAYDGSYIMQDTLHNGRGYWMKFPHEGFAALDGIPVGGGDVVVHAGWNIIGSAGHEVAAVSVTSTPPGIVSSSFYGYVSGFSKADVLMPGEGYWVKVNEAGVLHFPAP